MKSHRFLGISKADGLRPVARGVASYPPGNIVRQLPSGPAGWWRNRVVLAQALGRLLAHLALFLDRHLRPGGDFGQQPSATCTYAGLIELAHFDARRDRYRCHHITNPCHSITLTILPHIPTVQSASKTQSLQANENALTQISVPGLQTTAYQQYVSYRLLLSKADF